jgi:hypothetical protein
MMAPEAVSVFDLSPAEKLQLVEYLGKYFNAAHDWCECLRVGSLFWEAFVVFQVIAAYNFGLMISGRSLFAGASLHGQS